MIDQDLDPFAIPASLRRAPEDGARRRRRRRAKFVAVLPKGKRWNQAARYRVDLGLDYSGFPAGRRIVLVLIGRKWVSINHRNKHTRISRIEWDGLSVKEPLPS